jgi:hypothetical protein
MDIEQIRKNHQPATPLSNAQQARRDVVLGAVICLLLIGAVYALYQGWAWMFPPVDPLIQSASIDARDRKYMAEEAVRYHAKDRDSVKFRGVFVSATMVCGEYNGKNGFGAYVGFARFVSDGKSAIWLEEDAGRKLMDEIWQQHCQKNS